jgi:hypothetical protein
MEVTTTSIQDLWYTVCKRVNELEFQKGSGSETKLINN